MMAYSYSKENRFRSVFWGLYFSRKKEAILLNIFSVSILVRKTKILAAKHQSCNWALYCAPNNTTGDSMSEIWRGIRVQAVQHVYVALSLWFPPNLLSAAVYTNAMRGALATEFNRCTEQHIFSWKSHLNNLLYAACCLDIMNFPYHSECDIYKNVNRENIVKKGENMF